MIDQLLAIAAAHLGLSPAATVAALGILVGVANLVGKAIPDDATGVLGTVRKACKVIGLYVPNKTTSA